jgi:hypothetical protein
VELRKVVEASQEALFGFAKCFGRFLYSAGLIRVCGSGGHHRNGALRKLLKFTKPLLARFAIGQQKSKSAARRHPT